VPYATLEIALVHGGAGRSRIGGLPELPAVYAWPTDQPFLLQLDLADVAALDDRLPKQGLLVVFAAPSAGIEDERYAMRVAATVSYFADVAELLRRAHERTSDPPPRQAIGLRAERAIHWAIPYEEQPRLEAELGSARYAALMADAAREHHALFAAPAEEYAGPMPPAGEVALLRIHEDAAAGFFVGDSAWITFCIGEDDLAARRFENVRASVFIGGP
jgi:hypothetical protein